MDEVKDRWECVKQEIGQHYLLKAKKVESKSLKDKGECVKQAIDQYYQVNKAGEPGHVFLLKHADGKKIAIREETIFKLATGEQPLLVRNGELTWLLTHEYYPRYVMSPEIYGYRDPPILRKYRDSYPISDDMNMEEFQEYVDAHRLYTEHIERSAEEKRQYMNGKIAWIQQAAKDVEAGLIPYLVQNERGEWGMKQMTRAEPTENNLL